MFDTQKINPSKSEKRQVPLIRGKSTTRDASCEKSSGASTNVEARGNPDFSTNYNQRFNQNPMLIKDMKECLEFATEKTPNLAQSSRKHYNLANQGAGPSFAQQMTLGIANGNLVAAGNKPVNNIAANYASNNGGRVSKASDHAGATNAVAGNTALCGNQPNQLSQSYQPSSLV